MKELETEVAAEIRMNRIIENEEALAEDVGLVENYWEDKVKPEKSDPYSISMQEAREQIDQTIANDPVY